jgi:hypothetical protein
MLQLTDHGLIGFYYRCTSPQLIYQLIMNSSVFVGSILGNKKLQRLRVYIQTARKNEDDALESHPHLMDNSISMVPINFPDK